MKRIFTPHLVIPRLSRRGAGFTSIFLLIIFTQVRAQEISTSTITLNLQDTVNLASKNNPLIKQAEESLRAAEARVGQRQAAYYPSLTANYQYTKLNPDPKLSFPGFGTIQLFAEDNYDAHIGLRQTIFDFGKTSAQVAVSKSNRESAAYNLELIKTNVSFRAIRLFNTILLLEKSMEVQNQEISSLEEYLRITKQKVLSGTATDFDALTIEVKLSEAQNQKIDIGNTLNKEMISLKELLGLDWNVNLELTGDFSLIPVIPDENSSISKALTFRPEIKLAEKNEESAGNRLSAAKREDNPSLNLGFIYGNKNGYFPDITKKMTNYTGILQFNMELFNGLRMTNMIKEADADLAAAREHSRDTKDSVIAEIKQNISDVKANLEKLEASKLHVNLAEQAVEQAKVRYESGVITNLDLLNAQTSLAQANLFYLGSLYSYEMSKISLRKSAGESILQSE